MNYVHALYGENAIFLVRSAGIFVGADDARIFRGGGATLDGLNMRRKDR